METLFGRKKSRPRQSSVSGQDLDERSVPYDRTLPAARSPIPVGTVSQALRSPGGHAISAPITNPTLTSTGTELNKTAMLRRRQEREQNYGSVGNSDAQSYRSGSPNTSARSSEVSLSASSIPAYTTTTTRQRNNNNEGSAPAPRSPAMSDFGQIPPGATTPATPGGRYPPFSATTTTSYRPSSISTNRSAPDRSSRYTASGDSSLASVEALLHLPNLHLHHRHSSSFDESQFPRPETDEEIEVLFERVQARLGINDASNITIEQKWQIVHQDEMARSREARKKQNDIKRQTATGQPVTQVVTKDSPSWYLKKFMDMSVTPKHVQSLAVSLRTLPIAWVREFVSLQGLSVLGQALATISRKGNARRDSEIALELEIVRCIRTILNCAGNAVEVLNSQTIVNMICSLNSPNVQTRKVLTEILIFLCYHNEGALINDIHAGLEALSHANNEIGTYDYWFKSLDATLSGRGKMGSLVGASEEVRKAGTVDASLNDYALNNTILIVGLVVECDDLDLRIHHRTNMEAAGVRRIFDRLAEFDSSQINRQLKNWETFAAEDNQRLLELYDQQVLKNVRDPEEVFRAIEKKVAGTKANDYFLSAMRHLLLIRGEDEEQAKYYQLLDSLVSSIVLDRNPNFAGGLSSITGVSVARLFAQMGDQERAKQIEDEAKVLRARVVELEQDREDMAVRLAQSADGLVGNLQSRVQSLEDKLRVSRQATESLKSQIRDEEKEFNDHIQQLEVQITELFKMLREGRAIPSSSFPPSSAPPPPPPPPPFPRSAFSSPALSANSSGRPSPALGAFGQLLSNSRKDIAITPATKMKQLQWDKLPMQSVGKTLWGDGSAEQEKEWVKKLQVDGVWKEMEEDFKAKQLVINLMAKQKQAELKSVLDPQTKKRVEITIQRVRNLEPEQIAKKILQCDPELCTQVFLTGLKSVLPSPEQIGKLNVYRNAAPEELMTLHTADRLMVQLIKIERLGPRIEGMLYRTNFEETIEVLDDGAKKLSEAGQALQNASKFKELMNLILLIGNYMNSTGVKGGAFGFRVSSINKLVDTKSVNNTTLLHFLERTVVKHFPEMESFLDELAKPSEAYRVNLQDVRKDLHEIREGLASIRKELQEHFSDVDALSPDDTYAKRMWRFVGEAKERVDDLVDEVNLADTTFTEVVRYYGEDEKNMSSSEFYGIFKTFVTSYRKCKADNQTYAEERAAVEKRKQQQEAFKASKMKAAETVAATTGEDATQQTAALDNLIKMLSDGDNIAGKRLRRRAPPRTPGPLALPLAGEANAVDIAKDMLAQLRSDGFEPKEPTSPRLLPRRRTRTRMKRGSEDDQLLEMAAEYDDASSAGPFSPTPSTTTFEISEELPAEGRPPDGPEKEEEKS
ncbi:hypothetical protein M422DRAFT_177632 [Sphaerobolus stellatus SS14]|uniref:Cytokinesis protein sepA n=1 Tax=Sphaerobolus stellatus (strain SS14) TaxID=990650 RepID=A0A0C9VJT9_SPHS4|nr:hypothetical protein M422DRAFT_177632 [Sphaerobolus stellatus SS14]